MGTLRAGRVLVPVVAADPLGHLQLAADPHGSTGRVHAMLGVGVDFVVGSVDETARTWVWTVSKGPLTLDLTHRVVPEGDGCRTTLEMAGPLPALLAYAPLARLALGRLVRPQLVTPPRGGPCRMSGGEAAAPLPCGRPLGTFPGWSAGRARLTLNQDKRRRFDSYPGSRLIGPVSAPRPRGGS